VEEEQDDHASFSPQRLEATNHQRSLAERKVLVLLHFSISMPVMGSV
jgi:hypothetical protein